MPRTFFHTATDLPGIHGADEEKVMTVTTPGGITDFTVTGIGTGGKYAVAFTSEPNQPDAVTWPNGTYEARIDVPAMDSTVMFGLLTLGSLSGHFGRIDSGLTGDAETQVQAEPAFTTPGLKIATYTGGWVDNLQTDRVELLIAAQKFAGHGNDQITFRADGDGLLTGPWPGFATPPAGLIQGTSTIGTVTSGTSGITTLESETSEII